MSGFIIAGIMVGWVAVLLFIFTMLIDTDNLWWLAAAGAWFVLGIGAVINASSAQNAKGPCLRYETSMHYNPATKTMMPARSCVERAEWVTP